MQIELWQGGKKALFICWKVDNNLKINLKCHYDPWRMLDVIQVLVNATECAITKGFISWQKYTTVPNGYVETVTIMLHHARMTSKCSNKKKFVQFSQTILRMKKKQFF